MYVYTGNVTVWDKLYVTTVTYTSISYFHTYGLL